jgi:hypothetical protein
MRGATTDKSASKESVLYSNQYVVSAPFGFILPFKVALVWPIFEAEVVFTIGEVTLAGL